MISAFSFAASALLSPFMHSTCDTGVIEQYFCEEA
jgi:hypothetical protein